MAAQSELTAIEQQLALMERSVAPRWAWLLVALGLGASVLLAAHASFAYATIDGINQSAKISTSNAILLFQDLATNGPRVTAAIDSSKRGEYSKALTQYVLDGTGVCLGLALAFAGLFIRLNR